MATLEEIGNLVVTYGNSLGEPTDQRIEQVAQYLRSLGYTVDSNPGSDGFWLTLGGTRYGCDIVANYHGGGPVRWQFLVDEDNPGSEPTTLTGNASALIQPQLGLLEDDIVYRLALLAVNVLQPLKDRYPNIVVRSGFRQTNSGVGQHELGEAVDLQINNQTPQLLYEVACWIRDNLNFDQLILNFTQLGDMQPWIHVSFSPKMLRGHVLTKDFADEFHDGLYLVEPVTGEDAAALRREQQAMDQQILAEMDAMQKRQQKLAPKTTVADEALVPGQEAGGPDTPHTPGGSGGGDGDRAHIEVVAKVREAIWGQIQNLRIEEKAFAIVKRVAWTLRDEHCGLLIKEGGSNIISWRGYSFSTQRVCYPDGRIYDILTSVGDGTCGPSWQDNDFVETSKYVPAMDPGDEFGWQPAAPTANNSTTEGGTGGNQEPDDPGRR